MIDRMLGILRMGKLYEKYQELAQTPEFNTILNSLGGFKRRFFPTFPIARIRLFPPDALQNRTQIWKTVLKAMLTPQQLELFERLKASMNQPHD